MRWNKQGCIFRPDHESDWMASHASTPVADPMPDGRLRLYFGTRDGQGMSRIAYIDVDAGHPGTVLDLSPRAVLPLGSIGTFDESGIMPSSMVDDAGTKYLYYIGWNQQATVPYRLAIGLAISHDGGESFQKVSVGPIIDRDVVDPYFCTAPCVLKAGDGWRMWYVSCTGWTEISGRWEPRYHIRSAESDDGIRWRRDGRVCIDYRDDMEAIARPTVYEDHGLYRMFYAYRSIDGYRSDPMRSYRIGYATSVDGLTWRRQDDDVGIALSDTGWDSQMQAYPNVHRGADATYLFYSGNGFGAGGVGYATLATEPGVARS